MNKINALLIDDEEGAINTLQGMLSEFCPQVHILGVAQSISESVRLIATLNPDLIFLDIDMPPYGNGFDVIRLSKNNPYSVIFTTAHSQYAIKAINEVQPLAYLLKPFSVTDLMDAIQIAEAKLTRHESEASKPIDKQGIMIFDAKKGKIVLKFNEILYCKADGNICFIFCYRNNKIEKIVSSQTLGQIGKSLPEQLFFRIHNSYSVNMTYIQRLEYTGRNGFVHLQQGIALPVSVKRMGLFEERFNFLGG